eukprot:221605_1
MWAVQRFIGFALAALSIILAIVVILNTIQFQKNTKYRFIFTRKPSLILLYCIGGAIPCLLIITPFHILFHDIYDTPFNHWLLTFVQELLISLMSIVIALRCWLLYYDHSYQLSTVNKNWKGIIDPKDSNFWLENRKTWGDFGFILFFGLLLATIVMMAFSIVSIHSLQYNNMFSLQLTSLFIVYLPCYTFICGLIIYAKYKKTFIIEYDQFMIITEIQYLAMSTILITIICLIKLIQYESYELLLVTQTCEMLFVFITSWIQNKWVINRLSQQNISLSKIRINWKKVIDENGGTKLTMEDVLSTKHGFVMFMRHCQSEFNAEGLLFLSEVAQYKSKLNTQKIDPISFFTKPNISHKKTKTNINNNINHNEILPALNRIKSNINNEINKSFVPMGKQMFNSEENVVCRPVRTYSDHDIIVSNNERIVPKLKPLSLSNAATNSLRLFASNFSNINKINTHNKLNDVLMDDKKEEEKEKEDKLQNEPNIYMSDDEKNDKNDEIMISIQNAYDYGWYLFMKYIDVESEFSINVSYQPRRKMLLFFSKTMENGFNNILEEEFECGQKKKLDEHQKSEIIKIWLYQMFDELVCEVWDLLANDSFVRFMNSTQYEYLLKHSNRNRITL